MAARSRSGLSFRPEVSVRAPDGSHVAVVELAAPRMTVGRLSGQNDIPLEPDPDLLVTRVSHFVFEFEDARWYVVDQGSVNGTFLRKDGSLRLLSERTELTDGDVVCVPGALDNSDSPRYWELTFGDRGRTRPVRVPGSRRLRYDRRTARLLIGLGGGDHEIPLRRQSHSLVRYIAERNDAAGAVALCTHQELMSAVWGNEPMHTTAELNRLFWELRKELEPFEAQGLVESVRGVGYRVQVSAV